MTADSIVAVVTAVTALVAALGGFVTVLIKLKTASAKQATTSVKVDEIHAATVTPDTQPAIPPPADAKGLQ
jgi:hypothetical protein